MAVSLIVSFLKQCMGAATGKYRTSILGGMVASSKGEFYQDRRYATYMDLINHYNSHFSLHLSASEKKDLVEYQKSL